LIDWLVFADLAFLAAAMQHVTVIDPSRDEFEDETKTRQKIYNAVFFIVSHRALFKYHARNTMRAAYQERFYLSEK